MSGKYRWLGHRTGEIKSRHQKSLKLINCFHTEVSSPGHGRERDGVGRRDVGRTTVKEEGKRTERKTGRGEGKKT